MFSDRTRWELGDAPLAAALAARRRAGLPVYDLTLSNPTRCGFSLDPDALLAPLSSPEALTYDPQPFGRVAAREAVCRYYEERGAIVEAAHICLTTSTSEAYGFLFRLLCNPGDEVLIATPSYPLFDYLAALEDVRLVSYPLVYDHGWHTLEQLIAERITPRTRAIAVVHPNNPTGQYVSRAERRVLEALCVRHGLALIVDEVFLDYSWSTQTLGGGGENAQPGKQPGADQDRDVEGNESAPSFATGPHHALTFVLSGMSKIAALPQMKLSWVATLGPPAQQAEALARLEVIADTFLSVNAPVQAALPAWFAAAPAMQQQIRHRVAHNLAALDSALAAGVISRLEAGGGWYAVLRTPATLGDEAYALGLVQDYGVSVHPGSAFGFQNAGWLVISLLAPPDAFAEAVRLLVRSGEDNEENGTNASAANKQIG